MTPNHLHFHCDGGSEVLAQICNLLNANYSVKSVFLPKSLKNALLFFVSVLQYKEKLSVSLRKILTLLACSFREWCFEYLHLTRDLISDFEIEWTNGGNFAFNLLIYPSTYLFFTYWRIFIHLAHLDSFFFLYWYL